MKKIFRKLHLWLSVPFGVFITLVCFSGGCLAFEKEITEWLRHDLYYVEQVGERPLSLDSIVKRVTAVLPDTVAVKSVTVTQDAERCYEVALTKPRRASVYVNPYTGEVTGRNERLPFFDTMFRLHRWLLEPAHTESGSMGVGKWLVGAATLALVFILLTGLLMWLTNRRKPLHESLKIHVTQGWARFWHDLHVAGGIYATIFLLAVALTGLTWSYNWYRTGFYAALGVSSAESDAGGAHRHGGSEQAGRPEGRRHGDKAPDDTTRRHHHEEGAPEQRRHHHEEGAPEQNRHHHEEGAPEQNRHHHEEGAPEQRRYHREETAEASATATAEDSAWHGHRHHHEGDSTRRHRGGRGHGRHAAMTTDSVEQQTPIAETVPVKEKPVYNKVYNKTKRKAIAKADNVSVKADSVKADSVKADSVIARADWDAVFATVAKANPGYRQITLSEGKASVVPEGRRSLRATDDYSFDPVTGQVGARQPYADRDKATRMRGMVYQIHTGQWGGAVTRWLTFLSVVLGATLPLTGYYLWFRRLRNRRRHGEKKHEKKD